MKCLGNSSHYQPILLASAILTIALLVVTTTSTAQAYSSYDQRNSTATSLYIENKGQIGDQHGKPNHDVRFLILRPGLNIQLRQNGFSYDSYTVDRCELPEDTALRYLPAKFQDRPNEEITYRFHRVDVDLVGANPKPLITATGASSDYLNYYTHITQQVHGDKGATDVRGYARVTYHDVWPGVDMEWFIDDQQRPEYQFVIRPGGNVAAIQLRYRGAHGTRLDEEHLVLDVQHGPIRESLPRSYVQSTGSTVDVRYRALGGDVYGFTVPPIDVAMGETLVIDPIPELAWSIRLLDIDVLSRVDKMNDTTLMIHGRTNVSLSLATAGTWQAEKDLLSDAYLVCMSEDLDVRWTTYYGGASDDQSVRVVAMSTNKIAVLGETTSRTGIASANPSQTQYSGNTDSFLACLTLEGKRVWGRYLGGASSDKSIALAVSANKSNNIVVALRSSALRVLTTVGAYLWDSTSNASERDVVVILDSNGTIQWGTMLDNRPNEQYAIAELSTRDTARIVVAFHGSTGMAAVTVDAEIHQSTNRQNRAGCIAFDMNGGLLWGMMMSGNGPSWASSITEDSNGIVYLVGQTSASNGFATPGAFRGESIVGNGRTGNEGFLAAVDRNGKVPWCTYVGGESDDYSKKVCMLGDTAVCVVTETGSDSCFVSEDAHRMIRYRSRDNTFSFYDLYLTGYRLDGSIIWGLYTGGDGSESMSRGSVFAIGETTYLSYWSNSKGGGETWRVSERTKPTIPIASDGSEFFLSRFEMVSRCSARVAVDISYSPYGCTKTNDIESNRYTVVARVTPNISVRWQLMSKGYRSPGYIDDNMAVYEFHAAAVDTLILRLYDPDNHCFTDTSIVVDILATQKVSNDRVSTNNYTPCRNDSKPSVYNVKLARQKLSREPHTVTWLVEPPDAGEVVPLTNQDSIAVYWRRAGRFEVVAFVDDKFGCRTKFSLPAIVGGGLGPKIVASGRICSGQSIRLFTVAEEGAISDYEQYFWYHEGKLVSRDATINTRDSGLYKVVVTRGECVDSASIQIRELFSPTVSLRYDSTTKYLYASVQGCSNCRYQWFELVEDSLVNLFEVSSSWYRPLQSGRYVVSVIDDAGCRASSSPVDVRIVTERRQLDVVQPSDTIRVCHGDSTVVAVDVLGGVPPFRYLWTKGRNRVRLGNDSALRIVVIATEQLTCMVEDLVGSVAYGYYLVKSTKRPEATLSIAGTELVASPSDAQHYHWYNAEDVFVHYSNQPYYLPPINNIYKVRVDRDGCSAISNAVDYRMYERRDTLVVPQYEALTLSPNPADVSVDVETSVGALDELLVVDVLGQVVFNQTLATRAFSYTLSLTYLPLGSYMVCARIRDDRGTVHRICKPLVVQR